MEGPFAAGALRFGLENVPAGSPCNVGASDRPSRAGQPGLSQTQLDLDNIYFLASLPAFLMLQPLTFCFGRGAVAQDVFRFSVVFEEGVLPFGARFTPISPFHARAHRRTKVLFQQLEAGVTVLAPRRGHARQQQQ